MRAAYLNKLNAPLKISNNIKFKDLEYGQVLVKNYLHVFAKVKFMKFIMAGIIRTYTSSIGPRGHRYCSR